MKIRRDPLPTNHYGRLVFVEYRGRHPISAVVIDDKGHADTYDLDWSRTKQTLYCHMSGFGGDQTIGLSPFVSRGIHGSIWAAEGWSFTKWDEKTRKNVPLPDDKLKSFGYRRLPAPRRDPFKDALDGSTYWCQVCKDRLPDDDHCDHVIWIGGDEGWFGCGSCDEHKKYVFALLALLTDDALPPLKKAIATGKYETGGCGEIRDANDFYFMLLPDDVEIEKSLKGQLGDAAMRGVAWLMSLDPGKTRKAERQTVRWITEFMKPSGGSR